MNRLGKQLICNAWRKANHAVISFTGTSTRLYSVNTNGLKWYRSLYGNNNFSSSNLIVLNTHQNGRLSLLSTSKRFYQKASISEEQTSQENEDENEPQKQETQASDEQVAEFFREHQIHVKGLQDPRISKPIFDFSQIQLPAKLQALMDKFGYTEPTPIQSQSLPILFSGRDLIGIAQTGSGKTLAFLLPAFKKFFAIHRNYFSNRQEQEYNEETVKDSTRLNPKVLVLAPTRELAVQIFEVVKQFRMFKTICLYGGSDRRKQVHFLQYNDPLIVVSTPGRLKDLIDDECLSLKDIEYLVVDEADRMLDMGFEPQISYLINKCPTERQTMMFSASWPEEVKSLVHKYLRPNHAFLSVGGTKLVANHNIQQKISICSHYERADQIGEILRQHPNDKMIVFSNTKMGCDNVARLIHGKFRVRSSPIHGNLTQNQRERTLKEFRSGETKVLCATNVAARGLDIDDVNVVINYDLPDDIETYVHRIGRTGRKQNKGHAYSFFVDDSKTTLARDLIDILAESKNEVPQELRTIAASHSHHKNTGKNRFPTKFNRHQNQNRPYNYGQRSGGGNRPRQDYGDNDFYN